MLTPRKPKHWYLQDMVVSFLQKRVFLYCRYIHMPTDRETEIRRNDSNAPAPALDFVLISPGAEGKRICWIWVAQKKVTLC